jgi:hypothetical protein
MAQNKIVRFGPVALGASAANVLNPPTITGGTGVAGTNTATYLIVRHLRIVNKTAAAVPFSLWIGATGGSASGTEFMGTGQSVTANGFVDWYGMVRLDSADFLTGLAGSASALTIEGEGEVGIA